MSVNEYIIFIGVVGFFVFMFKTLNRPRQADGPEEPETETQPLKERTLADLIRADNVSRNLQTVKAIAKAYDMAKGKDDPAFFEMTEEQIEKVIRYLKGDACFSEKRKK